MSFLKLTNNNTTFQLPRDPRKSGNLINILEVDDPKLIVSFHLMGQLNPLNNMLANPLVSNLDVHFDVSRNLLKTAQELNATEGYIFKNLEKDGKQAQLKSLVEKRNVADH